MNENLDDLLSEFQGNTVPECATEPEDRKSVV